MMMANPEVYVMSPNRPEKEEHSTQNVIEIIANFIEKIPEMNVKFSDSLMSLKTSVNAPIADAEQVKINFTNEAMNLSKMILQNLKDNGVSDVKFNLIDVDIDPGMYRPAGAGTSTRQAMYTVQANFDIV
jgi:hypothetical protein